MSINAAIGDEALAGVVPKHERDSSAWLSEPTRNADFESFAAHHEATAITGVVVRAGATARSGTWYAETSERSERRKKLFMFGGCLICAWLVIARLMTAN